MECGRYASCPDAPACCPARDGTFLDCCPLACRHSGLHCLPEGRSDRRAFEGCQGRVRPDGREHALPLGAAALLCEA